MSSTDRYERRKEQNREAQRKFRLKKALVVIELENKVTTFENKAIALQQEVSDLQKDNIALRGQVQELRHTLSSVQKANNRYGIAEATGLRSPNPLEAQSNSQISRLCGSKDMISAASTPQPGSTKSMVLEERKCIMPLTIVGVC